MASAPPSWPVSWGWLASRSERCTGGGGSGEEADLDLPAEVFTDADVYPQWCRKESGEGKAGVGPGLGHEVCGRLHPLYQALKMLGCVFMRLLGSVKLCDLGLIN